MRVFASVDYDAKKRSCSVSCGPRTTPLTILDEDGEEDAARQGQLPAAAAQARPSPPGPRRRGPLLLRRQGQHARDREELPPLRRPEGGDEAAEDDQRRRRHRRGDFTTKSGSLRYVTDRKKPPTWIQGKKKLKLTVVPIEGTDEKTGEPINNYQLIYNELGVYLGEQLGNPATTRRQSLVGPSP